MNAPRSFANGGNPTRRSPMSAAAPWPVTEPDPRAMYSDRLYLLRTLAKAACPGAQGLKATSSWEEDGFHPAVFVFRVELTAPNVAGIISGQGASPEEATQGLKKKWGAARRAWDVAHVLGECVRLSDGNMTDTQRATLQVKLEACPLADFEKLAARARKQAQSLADACASQEYYSQQP